jgi:site-specific DNA recombinase
MSTNGKDRSGRIRIRCSAHLEGGSCPNPQTYYLDRIKAAVLSGLKAELRHPEVMADHVLTYHEERRSLAADCVKGRARIARRLAETECALKRLVDAICDGSAVIQQLEPQFLALEKEQTELRTKLEEVPEAPELIGLHPATLTRHKGQLAQFQVALAKSIPTGDPEAAQATRELIGTVTVSRDLSRKGGVRAEFPEG